MTTADHRKYPLGTDPEELERLHLQHRLWTDAAHALWRFAKVVPGSRVLDVGAGPGAASFDLAALATSAGRVLAIDGSESFVSYVRNEGKARKLTQLDARVCDVQSLERLEGVSSGSFDVAYARWVLCFTPRPEDVVRGVASLLSPGGRFCVHDYFDYETMTPAPRRESHANMVRATARSWRDNGGDPDVAGKLPALFDDHGLEVVHVTVHHRVARPGDTMWHWATTWWRSYTPKLVTMGYVTEQEVRQFWSDLDAMTPARDFLLLPPVFEIVGVKR